LSKFFVSYSRQSEPAAHGLVSDLEALGNVVWLDRDLSGGQAWWDQILVAIRECDCFAFVVDPNSLNSKACTLEFEYADSLGKPVLPVLVADGVSTNLLPHALSRLQLIDYRKADRSAALSLAKCLTTLPAAPPLPNPLPTPPDVPLSYLGGLGKRVNAASLTYDEQSALVLDLKHGTRDPESAADALALLKRLRKRRDLFAAIAEEIDGLIAPVAPLSTPAGPHLLKPESPIEVQPIEPRNPDKVARPNTSLLWSSWIRALTGALISTGLSAITVGSSPQPGDVWIASLIAGAGGAASGAITRPHKHAVVGTVAFMAIGFLIWTAFDSGDFMYARAGVFGAPIGAIVGSILGVILVKRQPH